MHPKKEDRTRDDSIIRSEISKIKRAYIEKGRRVGDHLYKGASPRWVAAA